MKFLLILCLILLLTSCGAIVNYDYDRNANFSEYKTYNYYPSVESGLSKLDEKRIMYATDSLLGLRGFTKSDSPQILINFFARESISNSQNTIGIGIGGGGRNVGGGIGGGIPIGGTQINQQLTLDFIDAAKDDLVWQAVSDSKFKEKASPKQKEAYYISVLQKILKEYPPAKN